MAGGHGGHVTTWDPNLFPGKTITTINCNGATDSAALASFVSAGVAANPAPQVLRLVGPRCNFESNNGLTWDGVAADNGIANAEVWAYGTTVNSAYIGGNPIFQDKLHSSRIATVSAGSTTVTLSTPAEATRYPVGSWICITGQGIQAGASFPPNFQLFEYHLVTANSGTGTGILTLNIALTYSYKSTWPLVDPSGAQTTDNGGPATIYLMAPSWNANVKVYGLTISSAATQLNLTGRDAALYDSTFYGSGFAPTFGQNISVYNSTFGLTEVDKLISQLSINNSRFSDLTVFSSSVENLTLTNVIASGGIGTSKNTSILGGKANTYVAGPNGFGHGVSVSANGVAITAARSNLMFIDKSVFSYSSGTFTVANASGNFFDAIRWGVPGTKYFFGFWDGVTMCNAGVTFTITDATQDGTNTNYITDLVGALPAPTCNANTYNKYVQYPAATITQINSPAGSANLTQFSAP